MEYLKYKLNLIFIIRLIFNNFFNGKYYKIRWVLKKSIIMKILDFKI